MPWQGVAANTCVFWDVADFPIPPDRYQKFPEFPKNIKKCLEIEGYRGDVSIQAYDNGKLPFSVFYHVRLAGITFVQHEPRKITRLTRMLLDLVEWASENHPGKFVYPHEINLLVISKDIPGEDTEFVNVLEELQRRKFNVFLVVPDDCPEEHLPRPSTASLVWRWTNLFDGKFPIISDSDDEDESDSSDEDESVTPSFKKKKESVTPTDADPDNLV